MAKGNPRALASRIQLGLPQVGAGSFFGVWYLVPQIGQASSIVLVLKFCLLIRLPSPSSIDRCVVVAFPLVYQELRRMS